jgi:hypothetical protein
LRVGQVLVEKPPTFVSGLSGFLADFAAAHG